MKQNIDELAKFKIAFFLQSLAGGGAERAIVALAGAIADQGFTVDLVIGDAQSDYHSEIASNVNVHDFSTRSPVKTMRCLMAYLRYHNPQVIMSALDIPNLMLIISAKLVGYKGKIFISQRAVIDASLRNLKPCRRIITAFLQKLLFPYADTLISNSKAAANELLNRLSIPAEKIITIQNAIDSERIYKLSLEPLHDKFIEENSLPVILTIGSLTKRKDIQTLIKAIAIVIKHKKVKLVILGKGPEQKNIDTLISKLNLEEYIHLPGFDVNPYKWIAASSVFVSSSTEEGFPNVIAEALALNCPVVATDCPGDTSDLLEFGKWGKLVPVGHVEQMSEAILTTINASNNPDGRKRAADFTPDKVTAAYLEALMSMQCQTSSNIWRQE
ncbi:MAG: glycosyltransferase [Gammaproteobacteria bacterium]|nr:MAG: glycosyltransferase [Gammaproteobacteria bacterium]